MSTERRRGGHREQQSSRGGRKPQGQGQRRHNQNGHRNSHNNHHHNNNQRDDDDKRERKPFVPWLGEERPSKGPILDLEEYKDQAINVSFVGGREITGILTGFDSLMNLVLENVVEHLGGEKTRKLGTLVARGPLLQSISPVAGSEVIENPF